MHLFLPFTVEQRIWCKRCCFCAVLNMFCLFSLVFNSYQTIAQAQVGRSLFVNCFISVFFRRIVIINRTDTYTLHTFFLYVCIYKRIALVSFGLHTFDLNLCYFRLNPIQSEQKSLTFLFKKHNNIVNNGNPFSTYKKAPYVYSFFLIQY